ncbi:hypothetical protein [Enterocloster bolteae]|jgi:hypothetical protein|uniref:hypothetical protein n=1 Tax=Enterocloster bolteae TaxID=208479 RepID=UPI0027BA557F|nr:hypothetical protein [Enterocloster bolteae]
MIRPILFNGDMVRAILEGSKTVTRRVIKPQFEISSEGTEYECSHEKGFWDMGGNEWACRQCGYGVIPMRGGSWIHAPYGAGDILYVRETWQHLYELDGNEQIIEGTGRYYYAATDTFPFDTYVDSQGISHHKIPWRPSIHMPKEAARIWLKVTDIRAERLHNLTNKDAKREGVTVETDNSGIAHRAAFMRLWDSTIKKSDIGTYGWNANPWIWVIEFERCEKPEPCILRGVEPAEEKRPCIGYGDAWADEPCEMCKGCSQCTGNNEEAEG